MQGRGREEKKIGAGRQDKGEGEGGVGGVVDGVDLTANSVTATSLLYV